MYTIITICIITARLAVSW